MTLVVNEVTRQSSTRAPPPEKKDTTKNCDEEIEPAEVEVPRSKESEQCMRNKNKRNRNNVREGLINRNGMLELVQNAFSRHRNTLKCPHCEMVGTLWRYRNTPGGLKSQKCGGCMIQTTGRDVITFRNEQKGEE